jgi:hypothetical protein
MGSNETKLSDFEAAKHQKLIARLLENHSLDAAFKASGISRNTGYRWIGTPEFQKAYRPASTHCSGRDWPPAIHGREGAACNRGRA